MPDSHSHSVARNSTELFRFVRVKRPAIIDLRMRIQANKELSDILELEAERQNAWAKALLLSEQRVSKWNDLSFDYFDHLNINELDSNFLPTKAEVTDLAAFAKLSLVDDRDYQTDLHRTLATLLAAKLVCDQATGDQATPIFNFLDVFPKLHLVDRKRRVAPVVLHLFEHPCANHDEENKGENEAEEKREDKNEGNELTDLKLNVELLWTARNRIVQEAMDQLAATLKEIRHQRFQWKSELETQDGPADSQPPVPKHQLIVSSSAGKSAPKVDSARQKAFLDFMRKRRQAIEKARSDFASTANLNSLRDLLTLTPKQIEPHLDGYSEDKIKTLLEGLREQVSEHRIKPGRLCHVYRQVVDQVDTKGQPSPMRSLIQDCFDQNPVLHKFQDTIQLLGLGELITVDEEFVRYHPGEISRIETILAGELRKKSVKSTKYFEKISETIREEVGETSEETSTRTQQDLSSEVSSEINTRFNSDLSASAFASGGGSIGVVDVEGGGSVTAGVGIGVDTRFNTSNTSSVSREIVNRAIERNRQSVISRRVERSYSLFESSTEHEVNNIGQNSKNGIYCFLDKEVCIRETRYGTRMFMLANIATPGKALICDGLTKRKIKLLGRGRKPEFNISPADIHPHNYKELVGKYRASFVNPPPSPIEVVAKTFKTDTSNENVQQQEISFKKVAKVLVPFFEQFKRFLITDTIQIPEGFEVQEIQVTVNHGRNGITVPAHLPMTLAGAALYASPMIVASIPYAGLLLPAAFWQIAQLASPIVYYNTDSSNVTATIGNQSYESPYFFFEPDVLIGEIFDLLGNLTAIGPDFLASIQDRANQLVSELTANATQIPNEIKVAVEAALSTMLSQFRAVLESIMNAIDLTPGDTEWQTAFDQIGALGATLLNIQNLSQSMESLFDPLSSFVNDVIQIFNEGLEESIAEFLSYLNSTSENNQNIPFHQLEGSRGSLPMNFNVVALNPGVTINVTACLRRTEEALDRWRLETFSALYQAYLQQVADYENRSFLESDSIGSPTSPGRFREQEKLVIKEQVMHVLNNLHGQHDNRYSMQKLNLFEHAIDWKNISYRLYNYGPNLNQIGYEEHGLYEFADDRRKAFLNAHWAQVMIPLNENENLEGQMVKYFEEGHFDFQDGFSTDELTALFQDLILQREQKGETDDQCRRVILPTDLVVIKTPELDSMLPIGPVEEESN